MRSAWKDWHTKKEGVVEPEVEKLEEFFKENNARRILDVGCGAGRHTFYFAKKGLEVYGFDEDEEAIENDRQILQKEELKADLRVWDMTKPLPYEDEFFDAMLAVRVIHHTNKSNIAKIVRELDRVLKPKGFLFLQVPSYESETFDSGTIWAEPGTLIARGGPEKGVAHHFFKKDELLGMFPGYVTKELHSNSDHYGGYCLIIQKGGRRSSGDLCLRTSQRKSAAKRLSYGFFLVPQDRPLQTFLERDNWSVTYDASNLLDRRSRAPGFFF